MRGVDSKYYVLYYYVVLGVPVAVYKLTSYILLQKKFSFVFHLICGGK